MGKYICHKWVNEWLCKCLFKIIKSQSEMAQNLVSEQLVGNLSFRLSICFSSLCKALIFCDLGQTLHVFSTRAFIAKQFNFKNMKTLTI